MLRLVNNTQKLPRLWATAIRSCGKSSNGSEDDSKPKEIKENTVKTAAKERLNLLLQQIVKDDLSTKKLKLAKPKDRRNLPKEPGTSSVTTEPVEKKIVSAVKNVAESLGGDTKQTESELLSKLLNNNEPGIQNLSDIVKGMKIDREPKEDKTASRAFQVKKSLEDRAPRAKGADQMKQFKTKRAPRKSFQISELESVNIFGSEPLGIFTGDLKEPEKSLNPVWSRLEARDLKLAVTHPPSNYFQEMILWTEQGKVWKFPIDNEQGMEEEKKVYFADHVFLEQHLYSWCPQKGPLRHFMELVCVGLSKNHHMSVETKKGHIEWYKNYFQNKKDLLLDTGVLPTDSPLLQKQIEDK